MVATKHVTGVDRVVRVIISSMAMAHRYGEYFPAHCIGMLRDLERELNPLVKMFGRPISQILNRTPFMNEKVILMAEWAYVPDKPMYFVCISERGWVLIDQSTDKEYGDAVHLLADIIGPRIEGANDFLYVCAETVDRLFAERQARLNDLRRGCLVREMSQAFDPSKFNDTALYIADL